MYVTGTTSVTHPFLDGLCSVDSHTMILTFITLLQLPLIVITHRQDQTCLLALVAELYPSLHVTEHPGEPFDAFPQLLLFLP